MKQLSSTQNEAQAANLAQRRARKPHMQVLPDAAENLLDKPEVLGIADPVDGTLLRDTLHEPLQVDIPVFRHLPEEGDYVDIWVQLSSEGDIEENYHDISAGMTFAGPMESGDFPLQITADNKKLPANGNVWLRYRMRNAVGQPEESVSVPLICDSTPPWGLDIQPAAPLLPATPIDDAYLATHGDLLGTLPAFNDQEPGKDLYKIYYFNHWPDEHDDYTTPAHEGPLNANRDILLPKDLIETHSDGQYYVVYYLFDKAGNKSRLSLASTIHVTLGALPENLQDPEVPLARGDNLLDLEDAIQGITVEIPYYDNARATDHLQVTWGGTTLISEPVGGKQFPISIIVPKHVLRLEYGNFTGLKDTLVSYQVLRGDVPFGPKSINVGVDFSVIGPVRPDPDPDWPDPMNAELLAPDVTGGSGNNPINILRRDDGNLDATFTFPRYANAADGQVVDFYWNGELAEDVRYTVNLSDLDPITVTLPWKYIEAAGNHPQLPFYYTIRASVDATNVQQSVVQFVDADAVTKILPLPAYEGINSSNWLVCASLREAGKALALRVTIPDLTDETHPGSQVRVYWDPYIGSSDSNGSDPVPGARAEWTIDIDANNIKGFTHRIEPYDERLLPIYDWPNSTRARARVRYEIVGGPSSEWAVQRISLGEGNDSCVVS